MSELEVNPSELESSARTLAQIAGALGSQHLATATASATGHEDLSDALAECESNWSEAWEHQRTTLGARSVTAIDAAAEYRATDSNVAQGMAGPRPRGGRR